MNDDKNISHIHKILKMSFGGVWRPSACCDRIPKLNTVNPPFLTLIVGGYFYAKKPSFTDVDGSDITVLGFSADFNKLQYTYTLAIPRGSDVCKKQLLLFTKEDILPRVYDSYSDQELNVRRVLRQQNTTMWLVGGSCI